jgi:hypothetical protein
MFGPRGNPQAKNLFNVIGYLQKRAGVRLHVTVRDAGKDVPGCRFAHPGYEYKQTKRGQRVASMSAVECGGGFLHSV